MSLTNKFRNHYILYWNDLKTNANATSRVLDVIDIIKKNESRYQIVANYFAIPWWFVAVIHYRESNFDFNTHLHNGDPIDKLTVHVPKGRPKKAGFGPFSFTQSAVDAIGMKWDGWSEEDKVGIRRARMSTILHKLEVYNGLGYLLYHPDFPSPYLWSCSEWYQKGKYTSDGKFDPDAIDKQIGVAVILKNLLDTRAHPDIYPQEGEMEIVDIFEPIVRESASNYVILKLQMFMNEFNGVKLETDGWIGNKTKTRYKEVFGYNIKE